MLARLWYGSSVRLCVFDLDHTLVHSPLDLAAMALDIRGYIERTCGALPARPERYRVGELIDWCAANAPEIEKPVWAIALDHERRALAGASLDPGARVAIAGARRAGYRTAIWTNNAREITLLALEPFELASAFDLIVTRDEMRALKPDPDGWRVIAEHFGIEQAGHAASYMVGDSWVDGLAATKAGVPFIAYRAKEADLTRWGVRPVAALADLAALPAWLARADRE
jgi:phosphoglycolate phosphatase-like HAD superfamily hydrolase